MKLKLFCERNEKFIEKKFKISIVINKLFDFMKEILHKKSLVFIQYESMNKIFN
jgi:hypothetical protein